jgi:hypothetical protein
MYVVNADGTGLKSVAVPGGRDDSAFALSPSGDAVLASGDFTPA